MTGRPRVDDLTDDALDALHDRLETAEALLRKVAGLMAITHRYASQGGHDVLGADLGCAGCHLHTRITRHLEQPAHEPGTGVPGMADQAQYVALQADWRREYGNGQTAHRVKPINDKPGKTCPTCHAPVTGHDTRCPQPGPRWKDRT